MFNKNNWHEPIYKNDLKNVLLFGITAMILGGIVTGLFDALLFNVFDIGIFFSLLLNALIIGFAVKKAYYSYHILYPVLALGFFFTALFISFLSFYIGAVGISAFGDLITSPRFYLEFLKQPIKYIWIMIEYHSKLDALYFVLYSFYSIMNIAFYVLGFISVYRIAKGRNR